MAAPMRLLDFHGICIYDTDLMPALITPLVLHSDKPILIGEFGVPRSANTAAQV
ncbi:hypothetical protein [Rhodococcoides kroppenstedtii]|uniref:hypothetical protein n=1 Tax=Rhodococcoides kroppenstedtii TaxID=293050 RepID=UPI00363A897B